MPIIDFHTHLADAWFHARLLSEAEYLAGLDRVGIEAACVFTLMGFYEDPVPYNDFLAQRARAHPGRLIPFVTVDPKQGQAAVAELQRRLRDPIFRGVKFHPWCQAFAVSMVQAAMDDILRCAADHDVPVLFHDGTPPYSTTFQIAAAARRVPAAKVVLGHAGLGDYVVAAGQLLRDIPNLYACLCGPKAGDLLHLLDMAGPDRVLWGSDYGVADWRILAERLDDVLQAGLDDDTRDRVLYHNARRLLHLPERPLNP